jgi:hypothetical protein
MDNDFKFTWSRMSLCFPEHKEDMNRIGMKFNPYYPESPKFMNDNISFAYKKDYGVQMFLNQPIEHWLQIAPEEVRLAVEKMHSDLSHKLYEETIKDLNSSFDIFEGWRKFITKNKNGVWEGNLKDHIDFQNSGGMIGLYDYYRFYINGDSKNNCPLDRLNKIGKLPKDSLNEKWKVYSKLAEKVSKEEIIGKDLVECVKNADDIYKRADELRDLKF